MTAERIAELLADSSKINKEPLDSFERLIIAYPYSQSMQFLYAKKLESLGKTELSKDVSWQVYFPDKNHLYSKIHGEKDSSFKNEVDRIDHEIEEIFSDLKLGGNVDTSKIVEQDIVEQVPIFDEDEVLEVETEQIKNKELDSIIEDEKLPIKRVIEENDYTEDIKFINVKKPKKKKINKPISKDIKSKKSPKEKAQKEIVKPKTKQEVIKPTTIVTKTKKKKKSKKKKAEPTTLIPALPETNVDNSEDPFVLWLASLKKKEQSIMESKDKKKKTKKGKKEKKSKGTKIKSKKDKKEKKAAKKAAKKQKKLQNKIDSSLNRRKEVASPTLADLLAKQGHNKEAIKIYKQLMLNNPEKNSYFASQIKKLK